MKFMVTIRNQFGVPLGSFQLIQKKYADSMTEVLEN
jgi:alkylation response protein AidB-like acyl-CoA dehydrogenase